MNKKRPTTKAELIAKYGLEWYENRQKECRERNRGRVLTKEQREHHNELNKQWRKNHRDIEYTEEYKEKHRKSSKKWYEENSESQQARANMYKKERFATDPIFKLTSLFSMKRKYSKIVTPEEAENLLKEEAENENFLEIFDINFIKEKIKQNNEFNLVYGNAQILKFFYKMMQIKIAKGESFTEDELNIIKFFRTANFDGVKGPYFNFENPWILDVINIDMAYIEDMIRNAKNLDLLLTEEKYLEMKGLTTEE